MTFEQQIKKLCDEAISCSSEKEAIDLTRRMQALMHTRIEELRDNLVTLRRVGPVSPDFKKAA